MKLSISSDIDLEGPEKSGYLTWLDATVTEDGKLLGTARIALVHVGEVADASGEIWPALHKTRLEAVHDAYFSQGWYKDEFADGAGIDLLYVDRIDVDQAYQGKNLDLAIVRRLCDTLGSGCQLAVMPYRDALVAGHWGRLGFTLSTPGRTTGLMHMKLGYRHARVVDATGTGDYEVVAADTESFMAATRSAVN